MCVTSHLKGVSTVALLLQQLFEELHRHAPTAPVVPDCDRDARRDADYMPSSILAQRARRRRSMHRNILVRQDSFRHRSTALLKEGRFELEEHVLLAFLGQL